jgi:crossover junction endodeoxyribonuclease RuvC
MSVRKLPSSMPDSPSPLPGSIRIMGIDPGSQRTGIGIIDVDAAGRSSHVYHAAVILLGNETFSLRLKQIFDEICAIIALHRPTEVAIERVFMARNPDSALKLGQARGAAICAVANLGLNVAEYSAREIKQCVVGGGGAEKRQVQHMVGILLNIAQKLQADAADALAIALTHAHTRAGAQRFAAAVGADIVANRNSAAGRSTWRRLR